MKALLYRSAGRGMSISGTPAAISLLLLAALTRGADIPCTATGWVIEEPLPGLWCTNAQGQMMLRGNAHRVYVESSDPRLTGERFMFLNGDGQADGSTLLSGTGYQQASGGLWQITFRGVMQADYRLQLSMVGYGVGGLVDGLRIEETMTRDWASSPIDPAIPYYSTGMIKPPPLSTHLFSDDFSQGLDGWSHQESAGAVTIEVVEQQFRVHADWRGVPGDLEMNTTFAMAPQAPWSPADGQTLECQVDLVSISQEATNVAFPFLGTGSATFYHFSKSQNAVSMGKYVADYGLVTFWCDNTVQLPATNVTLSLALTPDQENIIITTRVLDKNRPNALVFERSFVDTPQVDASLTTSEYRALTGITTVTLSPDPGPPIRAGMAKGLGVFQFSDGHQPPVHAIFDNFVLRLHEVPPLGIAPAVQLTWPAPAGVYYAVESAPTVQGPWLPVQELQIPGLQKLTIPQSRPAEFFRLRGAP